MSSRGSHVRTKVVALLVSLVALWAFAAVVTLRAGLNLLWADTLDQKLDRPTAALITALQQERGLSLVYLSGRTEQQHEALVAQRSRTDDARSTFERLAGGNDVKVAATAIQERHIAEAFDRLKGLDAGRGAIDAGIVDRSHAAATFTDFINAAFRGYGALATLDDRDVAAQGRTLVRLAHAREILSQEDALIAGMLAAGRFTAAEYASFAQLAGAARFEYAEIEPDLPAAQQATYGALVGGAAAAQLRSLEDQVIGRGGTGPLPVTAEAWKAAIEPVFAGLRDLESDLAAATVRLARPAAMAVLIRLGLAGGLGLIAVIASIVISISTVRSLAQQLAKLREAAWDLADQRLPEVVERIRAGEDVDVAAEAPPLTAGADEVGQVAQAFNAVQRTAVRVAVEQAELRRGVRDVFLNLARRTQALVHRQLTVLDSMERREDDPDDLADLFKVDHLATRMRRNAENLIVLSGAMPGRGWRHPVPMVDVIRGAIGEVEDYERVRVLPIGPSALAGRAVGDVIHLLAELVENATSFSPPDTVVQVGGHKVANGYAVEIEDRGLGMGEADLAVANEQLANPPDFNLSSTARLGLYVVGRLAERHGVRIRLRDSPYGGTTAIVLIPNSLVSEVADPPALPAGPVAADEPITGELIGARTGELPIRRPPPMLTAEHVIDDHPGLYPAPPAPVSPAPASPPAVNPAIGGVTPNGLPRRVRQASLAPPLRDAPDSSDEDADRPEPPPAGRTPDQVRRMMSSYQRGTVRGRAGDTPPPPVTRPGSNGQNRDWSGRPADPPAPSAGSNGGGEP